MSKQEHRDEYEYIYKRNLPYSMKTRGSIHGNTAYSTMKMELLGKFIEANTTQKETWSELLAMTTELTEHKR